MIRNKGKLREGDMFLREQHTSWFSDTIKSAMETYIQVILYIMMIRLHLGMHVHTYIHICVITMKIGSPNLKGSKRE